MSCRVTTSLPGTRVLCESHRVPPCGPAGICAGRVNRLSNPPWLRQRDEIPCRHSRTSAPGLPSSPHPRRLQRVRGDAIARAVFGPLVVRVEIVVSQVPELIGANPLKAAWADRRLTALDPALPLPAKATMARAVHLALPSVLHQPLPSLLRRLDLAPFRSTSAIRRNHDLSLQNRGETRRRVGEVAERTPKRPHINSPTFQALR